MIIVIEVSAGGKRMKHIDVKEFTLGFHIL